jgi:hypothetical protein
VSASHEQWSFCPRVHDTRAPKSGFEATAVHLFRINEWEQASLAFSLACERMMEASEFSPPVLTGFLTLSCFARTLLRALPTTPWSLYLFSNFIQLPTASRLLAREPLCDDGSFEAPAAPACRGSMKSDDFLLVLSYAGVT